MPFRLWFYVAKVSPVLFVIILATFFASSESVLGSVRFVALCLAVLPGLIGACMGLTMLLRELTMLCPFCGQSGPVGGNKRDGMWNGVRDLRAHPQRWPIGPEDREG
jgi:hypothetical protein